MSYRQTLFVTTLLIVYSTLSVATPIASLKEIRERGVVIQQWDISCGAAAVATTLTYGFQDSVSEEQVARAMLKQTDPLKVRRSGGFSLLDMRNFLQERGYDSYGMAGLGVDDIRYLNKPIVPVRLQGFKHFVVFEGVNPQGDVMIADPAWGLRTLDREQFEKVWLGGISLIIAGEK